MTTSVLAWLLWSSVLLIGYAYLGYPLLLFLWARRAKEPCAAPGRDGERPTVSMLISAYNEEAVIEAKLCNALALEYPRDRLEIAVVSDGSTSARYIAAELVGQAEHSPDTCVVLVTTSEAQAKEVAKELEAQASGASRAEIIRKAITTSGALLTAETLDEAMAFANEFAAEHLTLSTRHPSETLKKVKSAGSVFLGEWSPVALGDYGAGPNAILPTYGEAARRGGLSAATFQRTVSYQLLSKEGLEALAPTAMTLARVENLEAHRRSIEVRLGQ